MQKELKKLIVMVLSIGVLCMSSMADSIVRAEDVLPLETQVYQSNLKLYSEAASDQQTLQSYLQEEVAENVKKKAQEVTTGCTTEMDKLQAIHDWIANNIYYDYYGRAHDTVGSCAAEDVLKNRGTVCAGYANLTAAMCNAVGIPCKVVMGYALGGETVGYWTQDLIDAQIVNHAWNEAYVDGRWVILDTTWDSNSSNTESSADAVYKTCGQSYFNPSLDALSQTHKIVKRENAVVDASIDRKIDENLNLNISIKDDNIVFDWNVLDYADSYELQYNVVDGDAYGIAYKTAKDGTCGSTADGIIVPHYEESLLIYNDCWPMYFRLRMIKDDGTIWYSRRIEYTPPTYTVTFMDGATVVGTRTAMAGKSVTPPDLEKEGYTLSWNGAYDNVTADVIIYAVWTAIPTQKPTPQKPISQPEETQSSQNQTLPTAGTQMEDSSAVYKVTKSTASQKEVTYVKPKSKNKTSVSIPNTVKINGFTYKVTSIAPNALANNEKVTKVTIGKNVTSIGKNAFKKCTKLKTVTLKSTSLKSIGSNAFYGDKNLKTITIKSSKLTSKSVGKNAFKGTNKKLTIKVPKKKVSSYKKFLKKKGNKKITVKKG